jgi:O-antigen/teichoic acid export membrane protein
VRTLRRFLSLHRTNSPSLLLVGRLGSTGFGLVSAPLVARAIGPDGRGETAAVIAASYIVPIILALGVPLEIRRLAALSDASSCIRTARLFAAGAFFPAAVAAFILTQTLFDSLDSTSVAMAALCILISPLMMSWMSDLGVLVATGRFRAVMALQLAQPGIYLALVSIFWVFGIADTATIIGASAAGTVMTFALGLALVRVSFFGKCYSFKALFRGGMRFSGSAIAEAASNRLDQVLVLPLVGSYQAGLYSVAVTIGSAPLALGHALGAAYFSPAARAKGEERTELQTTAVRQSLAVAIVVCLLLALITPALVHLVFGPEFAAAVPLTWIVLGGSVVMIAAFVCSMLLAAAGKGWAMTFAQSISLIIAVVLLYVLSALAGGVGVALASSLAYVSLFALLLFHLRIPLSKAIPRATDLIGAVRRLL